MNFKEFSKSYGYKRLKEEAIFSCKRDREKFNVNGGGRGDRCSSKFRWVIDLVRHYEHHLKIPAADILDALERQRSYGYMNYYQEANFPRITKNVRVFDDEQAFYDSVGKMGFRCPACGGISRHPVRCTSGKEMSSGKICNWSAGGLFGTLGKGAQFVIKSTIQVVTIFMPVAWETPSGEVVAPQGQLGEGVSQAPDENSPRS